MRNVLARVMRNVLARVPKGNAEMVAAAIRTIFAQPDAQGLGKVVCPAV
jgi:hypothetical protein